MKRVFFHVQHLLGIGHLKRAATLCRTLAASGFEVTLASGGAPVPGLFAGKLVQLPPMSAADVTFKALLDERGEPIGEEWKRKRAAKLLEAWRAAKADVLIVELFPFGRRQLRFELLPLLDAAQGKLVVCSVRDVLQPRPAREDEALECFERYFDHLLVHGDPRIARFGNEARLAGKVHYTGYVVEENMAQGDAGSGEVLVSAGGGAVGRRLLEAALEARPLSALRSRPWRILAGVNFQGLEALQARAGDGVIVERFRNDFTLRLRNCVLSVSQAGYNTVVETLQARARAVLVPYAAGGEVEQTARAKLLEERGLVQVVEEASLSPATLAAAIDRAAAAPRPAPDAVDLDGARASAALLHSWLR